jgi:hypothetical protein
MKSVVMIFCLIISLLVSPVYAGLGLAMPDIQSENSTVDLMADSQLMQHYGAHQSTSSLEQHCASQSEMESHTGHLTSDCASQCAAAHCASSSCFAGQLIFQWPEQDHSLAARYSARLPLIHPSSLYRPPITA